MSKPRFGWWAYAKNMVREYPQLQREYNQLHSPRITREFGAVAGGHGVSRSTETIALRKLPPSRQKEYDAVTKAIQTTQLLSSGPIRLKLIDMVYWKQSHTLDGAAYALNYSYIQAKRFHREFIYLVGVNRGLCEPEDIA